MVNRIAASLMIALVLHQIIARRHEDPTGMLPTKGIVAVIVEETASRTPEITNVIQSRDISDYLDAHCIKDDKQNPEWRIWDKDEAMTSDVPKPLKDAFTQASGKGVPYMVVSNGRKGYAGPLPNKASTLATLKKYGG